jgi:prephenate dehydrogenase/chorismate mutase
LRRLPTNNKEENNRVGRSSLHRKQSAASNEKENERELARLRVHIEDVTKSIIDLISAREKLSTEVARIKRKSATPIENLKVESSLAAKTEGYANQLGVDPLLATRILSLILDSSKTVQREAYYEESIRSFLKEKGIERIAVIGAGRMGGWFASYFAGLAHSLIIFDQSQEKSRKLAHELHAKKAKSLEEIVTEADLVVVAIPISDSAPMIKKLALLSQKHLSSRSKRTPLRVLELCSVKQPLVEAGLIGKKATKGLPGNVTLYSIHPMFGPDVKHFAQNKILEISEEEENDGLITGLFPHFRIYRLDARTHDKMMSYILSLPHLLALLFADIIGSEAPLLKMYSGPSFERMLDMSRKVLSESPSVYFEIQSSNKENSKMVKQLRRSLELLSRLRGDRRRFRKLFERTKRELH